MAIDIPLNYTASQADVEQRMAYFREYIGVNLKPVPEPYFPKILNSATNKTYASRNRNTSLSYFSFQPDGERLPLEDSNGIDILGNLMENLVYSILSVNIPYYGNIHSMLHNLLGFAQDPDILYLEEPGGIGELSTAIRDPIFYRLHQFIDDLFEQYKKGLTLDTKQELGFPGVTIGDVSVQVTNGRVAVNRRLTSADIWVSRSIGSSIRRLFRWKIS
ncbi:phenoloxidase 8-like [Toxorhynchites rutilus septentrionalis]|uniref:phenoloxidase 8-like n=1 Tax=Toxorhynchites rutilus septentrionalis TaxID=329112 RepID=UPI002478F1C0|nr:phenoloxidase 8-like [Toxorhynchites rutilus septentrionalis]